MRRRVGKQISGKTKTMKNPKMDLIMIEHRAVQLLTPGAICPAGRINAPHSGPLPWAGVIFPTTWLQSHIPPPCVHPRLTLAPCPVLHRLGQVQEVAVREGRERLEAAARITWGAGGEQGLGWAGAWELQINLPWAEHSPLATS